MCENRGQKVGNLWIESDGTAKILGVKAFEEARKNGILLGPDDPRNTGTGEAKRIAGEIAREFE